MGCCGHASLLLQARPLLLPSCFFPNPQGVHVNDMHVKHILEALGMCYFNAAASAAWCCGCCRSKLLLLPSCCRSLLLQHAAAASCFCCHSMLPQHAAAATCCCCCSMLLLCALLLLLLVIIRPKPRSFWSGYHSSVMFLTPHRHEARVQVVPPTPRNPAPPVN